MSVTASPVPPAIVPAPRILVVDDESDILDLIGQALVRSVDCTLLRARSLAEARAIIENETVELLVTDVHLPDGDGTALLPALRSAQPNAAAIVITGEPSVVGAIDALRHGAVDFVLKPFTGVDLAERVGSALRRQAQALKTERRLLKLRDAVRRLNEARKVVSKKVDILCNDLISAYGELSKQLDVVRTQEGFGHFLSGIKDLEQLLCHTMDYLMRQMGYSNIAIWLAGDENSPEQQYQLGAYMKYTLAGEPDLVNAMGRGLVRRAAREGFVQLRGDDVQEKLTPAELDYLADQEILAVNCTYLGETLAVVILFRDAKQSFCESDAACLKAVSPLFAVALAGVVRGEQEESDSAAEDDAQGSDTPFDNSFDSPYEDSGDQPRDKSKRRKKRDDDDWWKTGGKPPF